MKVKKMVSKWYCICCIFCSFVLLVPLLFDTFMHSRQLSRKEGFVSKIDCDANETFDSIVVQNDSISTEEREDLLKIERLLNERIAKNKLDQLDKSLVGITSEAVKNELPFHSELIKQSFTRFLSKLTTYPIYMCVDVIIDYLIHDNSFQHLEGTAKTIVVNQNLPHLNGKHIDITFTSHDGLFEVNSYRLIGSLSPDRLSMIHFPSSSVFLPTYASYSSVESAFA